MTLDFMRAGANGVVSVASNLIPKEMVTLVREMSSGNVTEAERIASRYHSLFEHLFLEVNPAPTKEALARIYGEIYTSEVRLPLVGMTDENRDTLITTLQGVGLIR